MIKSRKFWAFLLGVAALIAVSWLIGVGTPGVLNLPRFFSTGLWRESSGPFDKARCSMVYDLRHRIGITGKTRSEIEKLLGPPDLRYSETTEYVLCSSPIDIDHFMLEIRWIDDRSSGSRIIKS
jgi:hypothetical protein